MAKNTPRVLPHDPIVPLASNLWWVQGALPNMSLKRCMVVARLANGELLIHNAILLEEPAMQELEALGRPAILVVPNGMHRLDAPAYKERYPGLRVFAPRGSRAEVEQVIGVDGVYEDFPGDEVARLEGLPGVGEKEGVLLVRSEDGVSVVLNDVVFNMDKKKDFLGWFFTTLLGSAPGPRVSRLGRLLLVKDRAALRAELLRLAELEGLTRLVVAHEKIASGPDAAAALRQAATFL